MKPIMITTKNTTIPAYYLGVVIIDTVQVNHMALYDGPEYEPIYEEICRADDGKYYLGVDDAKALTDEEVAFYMASFISEEELEADFIKAITSEVEPEDLPF